MTRLRRSRRARQMDGQKSENDTEETGEVHRKGSLQTTRGQPKSHNKNQTSREVYTVGVTRLERSRKARRTDGHKWPNNVEETSEIVCEGSLRSTSDQSKSRNKNHTSKEVYRISVTRLRSSSRKGSHQRNTDHQSKSRNENQTSKRNIIRYRAESRLMYIAALGGDWQAAEMLLKIHPNLASAIITRTGDTALHVAAAYKHTEFVQELVKWMHPTDLLRPSDGGYTAFCYAAASGKVAIASEMIEYDEKDKSLLSIRGRNKILPLHMAVLLGNRDMASYIQRCTPVQEYISNDDDLFELFKDTIRNGMYDVALGILKNNLHLATMKPKDGKGGTALHVLAQHDISDICACRETILERFAKFAAVARLSWLKEKFEQPLMRKKARLLAEKLWAEIQRLEQEEMLELVNKPPILHDAARAGNVEFITMLTRTDPDLIWDEADSKNEYTIFHIAVLERQESVFRLIHQTGSMKHLIAISEDGEGNNILHLAGKLAPRRRLTIVSGPALQMQRELMWFKGMENILPPFCLKMKNKAGLRPRELFSKKHEKLLKEGETWMRETADSCMLIATIMLTAAFTAAFTVPGGNNSDTGIPVLWTRRWFKLFVASDVLAMSCATFSILMFLSILTSRFQEVDFLVSLPGKLLLGLLGLFGALLGTMSAFTSAYFLMFNWERAWLPAVLGGSGCVLLTSLFLLHHFGLILDTTRSTIRYKYLFRPSKHKLY